jgi:hypothetical protein
MKVEGSIFLPTKVAKESSFGFLRKKRDPLSGGDGEQKFVHRSLHVMPGELK